MAFDLNAFFQDAWKVISQDIRQNAGWIGKAAQAAEANAAKMNLSGVAAMGSLGRAAHAAGNRATLLGGMLKEQWMSAWNEIGTTGGRAALIGMGALAVGGSLYALNNLRRGDYFGAAMGGSVAGLGAWLMLRNGVGPGLRGVLSAYEKKLIESRYQFLRNPPKP